MRKLHRIPLMLLVAVSILDVVSLPLSAAISLQNPPADYDTIKTASIGANGVYSPNADVVFSFGRKDGTTFIAENSTSTTCNGIGNWGCSLSPTGSPAEWTTDTQDQMMEWTKIHYARASGNSGADVATNENITVRFQ